MEKRKQKNPLLVTLLVIDGLAGTDRTAKELTEKHSITDITLKRYISHARHLGAAIVSVKKGGRFYYRLDNHELIKKLLNRWIELEENSTLLD